MRRMTCLAIALSAAWGAGSAMAAPADEFMDNLRPLCGQAFEGRVVRNTPANPDDPFTGKTLVMHVRECAADQIKIPFHVGEDRSRTWVLTRTSDGVRLKHDHRHEDGSEDKVTQYGGDTAAAGTANRQEFPVDEFSKAMFTKEGLPERTQRNVWAMEVHPDRTFIYELTSTGTDRLFQVHFDLTKPVSVPPAPWGHQ